MAEHVHVWTEVEYQDGGNDSYWECYRCGASTHENPERTESPTEGTVGLLAAHIGPFPDCSICAHCEDLAEYVGHLAAVLDAHVTERCAEAWDEGMRHESEYLNTFGQFCPGSPERGCDEAHNPYRAAAMRGEG